MPQRPSKKPKSRPGQTPGIVKGLAGADQADVRVVGPLERVADRADDLLELLQILAGAEAATGASDHDRPYFRRRGLLERSVERGVQRRVEGVEHFRPVERDRQDGAVPRGQHFTHGESLKRHANNARTRPIASGASR